LEQHTFNVLIGNFLRDSSAGRNAKREAMKKSILLLGLVILLGSAWSVRADPIKNVFVDRLARSFVQPTDAPDPLIVQDFDRDTVSASITATTTVGILSASATLTSQFSASERAFFGTGTASNSVSPETAGIAQGSTLFRSFFTLTEPQQFSIDGLFRTTGANTSWQIVMADFDSELQFEVEFHGTDNQAVSTSGLLSPGDYFMQVTSFGAANVFKSRTGLVDHSFRVAFADPQVTPTPEPASLLLLGTGVAAVVARHPRKSAFKTR
jgi:hypothetical protein